MTGPLSIITEGALTSRQAWPAPAKLNLFLHITGRRPDGYHELQTVFQFVDHGDSLFFDVRNDGAVRRPEGPARVAEDADLSVRAARALKAATGCSLGVEIHIDKRIPMGAGLGGGSSDAATTLVALNQLWNTGLDTEALATIGLRLGADVPVFVRGHAAWGEGIGEQLTPITLPEPWYLVVTPNAHVDSGDIFRDPDLPRCTAKIDQEAFLSGTTGNDCEGVACARYPVIAETLARLRSFGPARMSGTGSSVFCPFPTREDAVKARAQFAGQRSFLARGVNHSPLSAMVAGIIAVQ